MLVSVRDLHQIFKVRPSRVLHVGAHLAEEEPSYRKHGWGTITWIEAQPNLVRRLKQTLPAESNNVVEGCIWSSTGEKLTLNIASNSQSSSLLEFGTHVIDYPAIRFIHELELESISLDDLLPKSFQPDFLNLDIQGVELEALQGFENRISHVKWIYTEVNIVEVYKNCALIRELDEYLKGLGFIRLVTKLAPNKTWGDALYVREGTYSNISAYKMKSRYLVRQFFSINVQKRRLARILVKLRGNLKST
jgi:FkbM family methyltransferase